MLQLATGSDHAGGRDDCSDKSTTTSAQVSDNAIARQTRGWCAATRCVVPTSHAPHGLGGQASEAHTVKQQPRTSFDVCVLALNPHAEAVNGLADRPHGAAEPAGEHVEIVLRGSTEPNVTQNPRPPCSAGKFGARCQLLTACAQRWFLVLKKNCDDQVAILVAPNTCNNYLISEGACRGGSHPARHHRGRAGGCWSATREETGLVCCHRRRCQGCKGRSVCEGGIVQNLTAAYAPCGLLLNGSPVAVGNLIRGSHRAPWTIPAVRTQSLTWVGCSALTSSKVSRLVGLNVTPTCT